MDGRATSAAQGIKVAGAYKGYPTDVSDKEWKLVEPLLPGRART